MNYLTSLPNTIPVHSIVLPDESGFPPRKKSCFITDFLKSTFPSDTLSRQKNKTKNKRLRIKKNLLCSKQLFDNPPLDKLILLLQAIGFDYNTTWCCLWDGKNENENEWDRSINGCSNKDIENILNGKLVLRIDVINEDLTVLDNKEESSDEEEKEPQGTLYTLNRIALLNGWDVFTNSLGPCHLQLKQLNQSNWNHTNQLTGEYFLQLCLFGKIRYQ